MGLWVLWDFVVATVAEPIKEGTPASPCMDKRAAHPASVFQDMVQSLMAVAAVAAPMEATEIME